MLLDGGCQNPSVCVELTYIFSNICGGLLFISHPAALGGSSNIFKTTMSESSKTSPWNTMNLSNFWVYHFNSSIPSEILLHTIWNSGCTIKTPMFHGWPGHFSLPLQAETLEVAPFAVPSVVDGTAAGDAFRAALAVALGEKQVVVQWSGEISKVQGLPSGKQT